VETTEQRPTSNSQRLAHLAADCPHSGGCGLRSCRPGGTSARGSAVAPVRSTEPSSMATGYAASSSVAWPSGSVMMRQKSALPGVGRWALGSNSRPACGKLILEIGAAASAPAKAGQPIGRSMRQCLLVLGSAGRIPR
jgi:hypothetical protein